MRASMERSEGLNSMIEIHDQYIQGLQDRCFLSKTYRPTRQPILSLLDMTVLFSDIWASHTSTREVRQGDQLGTHIGRSRIMVEWSTSHGNSNQVDDKDARGFDACLMSKSEMTDTEKLRHSCDTYSKLHGFVTAAVQGISRANDGACWDISASSLAAGLGK